MTYPTACTSRRGDRVADTARPEWDLGDETARAVDRYGRRHGYGAARVPRPALEVADIFRGHRAAWRKDNPVT
jgi:hypothetical protein